MSTKHPQHNHQLAVGTRLHLGNALSPPEAEYFRDLLQKFSDFASSCNAKHAYVAVDSTPEFPNYRLEDVIQSLTATINSNLPPASVSVPLQIIPVTPWNAFVPALNAIASRAAQDGASLCLFCSAETSTSPESIQMLLHHMDDHNVLVAGVVLPGHDYQQDSVQPLNGRTTPWNTLAVWNLAKLTLTGFPLVADGLHYPPLNNNNSNDNNGDGQATTTPQPLRQTAPAAGVEEVSTIALLQHVLGGPTQARAKLVRLLPDGMTTWDQEFEGNRQRQEWHEYKMKSKLERAAVHLKLLNLTDAGVVEHC